MKPFTVSIYPELTEVGDSITLFGVLDEESYSVGLDTYRLVDGIHYDIVLTNTGEAILVTGIVRVSAIGECARCLEEARFDSAGEVEGYYLLEAADKVENMEADEFDVVDEKGSIDISSAILAALVIETPFALLCDEDCLGLCPTCGTNLNESDCGCADKVDDSNPFAALKDLLSDKDKDASKTE